MSSNKLNPYTIAALLQALTAGIASEVNAVPLHVVIDDNSTVPVRDQVRAQILAQLGEDQAIHATGCENCENQINAITDDIVAKRDADQAAKKAGSTDADPAAKNVGSAVSMRKPELYAVFINAGAKQKVLPFTAAETEEKSREKLKHAEAAMSAVFNDYEIKPLYL